MRQINTGDLSDGLRMDDLENANILFPLRLYIENIRDERIGGFTIPLPAKLEDMRPLLDKIEIKNWWDIKIMEVHSDIEVLREVLTEAIKKSVTSDTLNELNYLATQIGDLHPDYLETFLAVLEAKRHCNSVAEIINLTENLNCFELQPAFDAEMLGEDLLSGDAETYNEGVQKLYESQDEELHGVINYIEILEKYVNYSAYGEEYAENENGVFTENGYLTEHGEFKEIYRGPEDIPDEYKVLAMYPFMKVENTDLTDLLLKMHALGGEYMHDAHYNLNVLANRNSAEHLLLMNGRDAFLAEADHAYRHASTAYDFWIKTAESPDTRAFAIHVTDMHDPRDRVIGDIVEVDFAERQRDILDHCIHFTRVDATPKFGPDCSYTHDEWNGLEAIDRVMLGSWTIHFEPDDQQAVLRHLEDIRAEHANAGKAVEPDALLFDLSGSYMAKAENPQPDMYRVNLIAAKDLLSRGGAPVYRLMPKGAEELSALDTMPSRGGLWYQNYREFAIKKDDIKGLDRWADRTADTMLTRWQPKRDMSDKAKPHDLER